MATDPSHGWNTVAQRFIQARSNIGADTVRKWAGQLPTGGDILDVGCGSGAPISTALAADGFQLFGIDASPVLVAEFRRRLPLAQVVCEAAETSSLFQRSFDGAVAVGLLFLLPAEDQRKVIGRVARALKPGGRFLFSAPRQACEWADRLTARPSLSLGEAEYRRALDRAGLRLAGDYIDEGGNHYFDAVAPSLDDRA